MRYVLAIILLVLEFVGDAAAQADKTPRLDFNGDPLPDVAIARLGTPRFVVPEGLSATALSSHGTTVILTDPLKVTRIEFMSTSTGKNRPQTETSRFRV